jgi:hypothetical protein
MGARRSGFLDEAHDRSRIVGDYLYRDEKPIALNKPDPVRSGSRLALPDQLVLAADLAVQSQTQLSKGARLN